MSSFFANFALVPFLDKPSKDYVSDSFRWVDLQL